ncbi:MAG: type II toxin-antitoxin system RelE/ParE family toxin [Planctomycetota bacterium]|jgi:phage-related protein
MKRIIDFYRTADGKCPVEEFLDSLDGREAQKVAWVLELIEDADRVNRKHFKKLVNTEDIYEVRVKTSRNIYRVFSFFFRGNRLVLTHGYTKKTQKTTQREINRAEEYRRDFFARHKET